MFGNLLCLVCWLISSGDRLRLSLVGYVLKSQTGPSVQYSFGEMLNSSG